MAWTYDPTNLDSSTDTGRRDIVRFLLGDTDFTDQQVTNEEVLFALDLNSNDTYRSASWLASRVAAKYARYVDTDLDGQLAESYSQLHKHYTALAAQLSKEAGSFGGNLMAYAGGINKTDMEIALRDPKRPRGFYIGQFDNGDLNEYE